MPISEYDMRTSHMVSVIIRVGWDSCWVFRWAATAPPIPEGDSAEKSPRGVLRPHPMVISEVLARGIGDDHGISGILEASHPQRSLIRHRFAVAVIYLDSVPSGAIAIPELR